MGFEWRSRRTLLGIPWIHVAWGVDPFTGRLRVARGVIAVGPFALGPVAIGPVAVGLVAAGQLAVGLGASAGQISAALFAAGQVALAVGGAAGQLATGTAAVGLGVWEGALAPLPATLAWMATAALLARVFWRQRRPLARLLSRHSRIASASPGAALLRGRVLPLRTLEAPVSRRPCIAYDVRRLRAGDRRPIRVERECEDFVVDDGTGVARVLTSDDAIVLLEPARRALPPVLERRALATVDAAPVPANRAATGAPGTVVERVLVPGETVLVAGQALRSFTSAGSQLAVQGGGHGPLLVTNRDPGELRAEAGLNLWLAALLCLSSLLTLLLWP